MNVLTKEIQGFLPVSWWKYVLAPIVTILFLLLLVMYQTGGQLNFTLDDPYIHLAVAENILKGTYGVNLGEFSAPSSSIIWPFLLLPLAGTFLGPAWAFVLNVLFALCTVVIFAKTVETVTSGKKFTPSIHVKVGVVYLVFLFTNLAGLSFLGMEHTLQVFMASILILGVIREIETSKLSPLLLIGIIVAPLVRYELLALTVPTLLLLVARGHNKPAIKWGFISVIPLVIFSLFLHFNNHAPLPTSVLSKSSYIADTGRLEGLLFNFFSNWSLNQAKFLVQLAGLSFLASLFLPLKYRLLSYWLIAATLLHLAVGRFGWFHRYEIYVWGSAIIVSLYTSYTLLQKRPKAGAVLLFILAAALPMMSLPYIKGLAKIPAAAEEIYSLHYNLHILTTEHIKAPVGVTDLGWVAYNNPFYVFDYAGLANAESLSPDLSQQSYTEWRHRSALENNLKAVFVFTHHPKTHRPPQWTKVGRLSLPRRPVTSAGSAFDIYVPDLNDVQKVSRALRNFRPHIKKKNFVSLEIVPVLSPSQVNNEGPDNN